MRSIPENDLVDPVILQVTKVTHILKDQAALDKHINSNIKR